VALLALIGWVGLAWASAAKADLRDAEDQVDEAWVVLRPTLDQRYTHLASLVAAEAAIIGPATDPIPAATAALAQWQQLTTERAEGDGPDLVEAEVAAATVLEGYVGRLLAIAGSTERLRVDPGVSGTADAVERTTIALPASAYNDAVDDYASERERFPARALVGVYGFDPRHPFAIPAPPGAGTTTTGAPADPTATTAPVDPAASTTTIPAG
jgi:hypothetical protein